MPTFARRWTDAVSTRGDAPFLRFEAPDGAVTEWSYQAFDGLVARVAGGLVDRGARPGLPIHLALTNSPAFVAVWLAASRLGAWIIPSDPKATPNELSGHVARTQPVVGVGSAERSEVYKTGVRAGPEVVIVDEADPAVAPLAGKPISFADFPEPAPGDRAAVMFTSGTTSTPKGVVLTQANYAFAGDVMAAAAALRGTDRQLVVLPMFHANAQYYSFASAISVGASVALMHTFSATRFLDQAARHQATHASLFAAPMRMILARGATPVAGLRLTHCWYAQNITEEQYDTMAGLLGCRPRQLYGMTETIPAVLTNRALDPIADAMGEVTLGCHVELRGEDDGRPVGEDEIGEIVIGGVPGSTLFAGYLDDPDTTARSYRDELFRSGDLAIRHGDRFFFAGRQSDVLKVAGENVSVVEIEATLTAHPSVLEAAVVGEPDEIRDEVPVAFVVQEPGKPTLEVDDVARWCEERLSKVKRPIRIEIVDELPRTSVGKIRKFMLKSSTTARGS